MRRLPRRAARRLRHLVLAGRFGAIVGVNTTLPMVALTFDDGPHPEFTPRLIETFAKHGARATHFLVGASAAARPDLVNALVDAGHVVANHGYAHRSLVRLGPRERYEELAAGRAALLPHVSSLMRPPYGHYDLASARTARALGMRCVLWTKHLRDWEPSTAEELQARLEAALKPGAIILLHEALFTATADDQQDREPLLAAIAVVLERLSGKVRFGTVPELLAQGAPVLRLVEKRGADDFIAAQRAGTVQDALGDILTP
ncbi:MAG TPA: polysaccharide deacetylase family protein [Trueperaceae bacterium]|nr:polysaccharide deacetylase family protein [Trueperaceae bacterium]